ncbi:class I SAM-dependent methyltransferase [Paenibacillus lutrae]|uniref:Methyltransferase domain-containing protein n=1 Tax=Paenibacillus lutrae TaxID=2078573 RepID=A0A7X3FFR8_9BACL|nr:class I SAM-dependent methyltransferase [Paenibacillus lutrae]MVO98879.1 methyltransferase domain-containing protein [Paenibacillus lutrae]
MADREHWHDFFGADYLLFSEVILHEERTAFEVDQLLQLLRLPQGARILDLGCGQGRISVPLARRGYKVTGMDASRTLLAAARKRAESAGTAGNAEFVELDMRGLEAVEEFDAVINLGTAFGYLQHEEEDRDIVRRIVRSLKPGGQFIQETENREFKLMHSAKKTWDMMNGQPVWSQREFDSVSGRWNEVMNWLEAGNLKTSRLNLRLYAATELLGMHTEAGLIREGVYGGFDFSPLTTNSPRLLIHLKKKQDA